MEIQVHLKFSIACIVRGIEMLVIQVLKMAFFHNIIGLIELVVKSTKKALVSEISSSMNHTDKDRGSQKQLSGICQF